MMETRLMMETRMIDDGDTRYMKILHQNET